MGDGLARGYQMLSEAGRPAIEEMQPAAHRRALVQAELRASLGEALSHPTAGAQPDSASAISAIMSFCRDGHVLDIGPNELPDAAYKAAAHGDLHTKSICHRKTCACHICCI